MHPMNHSSNFQDYSLSKSAQNGVSTFVKFVKIACVYIGNKCVNLCKFCGSDFGVIIWGKWLQMIGYNSYNEI